MYNDVSVIVNVERNHNNGYYYLCIKVDYGEYYNILIIQNNIINYFNLPRDYWYNELSKFNCILRKETILGGSLESYSEDQIYFENIKDCKCAKKWFEDNLDYFLMLKKLGGK